jgi:hypothetical protein
VAEAGPCGLGEGGGVLEGLGKSVAAEVTSMSDLLSALDIWRVLLDQVHNVISHLKSSMQWPIHLLQASLTCHVVAIGL